ncbi:MAG: response regulator transcription factor [Thermodesulfobacteriota bacterium]
MRIMIFENDAVTASYLTHILKQSGHQVFLAKDGGNTAEQLRRSPADLVITDIFLANTSGLQVVLDVKGCSPGTKVLAVSGGGETLNFDYLDYALEFGADAVLRKPLDETSLLSVLEAFSPSGEELERLATA